MPEATSTLMLHAGARPVQIEELEGIKAPPAQGRWYPLSHGHVLARVKETLQEAGYIIRREKLALSRCNSRFFGTLDLVSTLLEGVSLAVGVRNSIDKSFPIGFCAGSRVFCCDNLAFSAELLVKRKHTRFGEQRFAGDIAAAMPRLNTFQMEEAERITRMQSTPLTDEKADSLILRAFERGIITTHELPQTIREWRKPEHDAFRDRNHWSLLNAFTAALADKATKNAHRHALLTMRLTNLVLMSTAGVLAA